MLLWTVRGAPHLHRRADLPSVAAAVAPFSDADAGKRVHDAAKPLKAAGITPLEALDTSAATMRSVVTQPTVKGEVSSRLTALLDPPHLRAFRTSTPPPAPSGPTRAATSSAGTCACSGPPRASTSPPTSTPL
ncbi:hypothetical protein [Quadrisphaera sp. DSM 44207]|uniref:hypothetical protein n=1 Tax=Quadrisphaera sp. DSM 44207 TaxID=1881057 RepID=UPI0008812BFE|nr:hypothetical protein [Quadrisphaera sp. DSM 44207]SDQ85091.1 hypothetical protein SAMN05428996_2890 [Quadrisphaera sp. DSM 44207]